MYFKKYVCCFLYCDSYSSYDCDSSSNYICNQKIFNDLYVFIVSDLFIIEWKINNVKWNMLFGI